MTDPLGLVSAVFPHVDVAAAPFTCIPPMVVMVVDAHVSGEMEVVDPVQFPAAAKVTDETVQPTLFHAQVHALQSRVSAMVSATASHDDVKPAGHDETHVGGKAPE
jgi:hypothetical protein